MALDQIPGYGRVRFQLEVQVDRLHLDPLNPRLPSNIQGKSESEVLKALYDYFNLEELAVSMSQNGYFDEEPLVAIPREVPKELQKAGYEKKEFEAFIREKNTHFTIVEGNRRLATIKILLDKSLQQALGKRIWPALVREVQEDLSCLPLIVYPERDQVVAYLGVRHITGIKKWDAYSKARYIVSMLNNGLKIEDIEQRMGGDQQGAIRKNVICFRMLEQAHEEFDYDIHQATQDFSFLILSIGQGSIKRFLGLPSKLKEISLEQPIKDKKFKELKNLLSWIFGEGKQVQPVIKESRDITNFLSAVVSSPEATKYLEDTRKLEDAYDLSDGEETMLKKSLARANNSLEKALGIAHRHKTPDVKVEVKKCLDTAQRLHQTVNE